MSNIIRFSFQTASHEMIAKLIKAGYLPPALRHDANAITRAITQMKQDLRGRSGDDGPRAADGDGPSAAGLHQMAPELLRLSRVPVTAPKRQ